MGANQQTSVPAFTAGQVLTAQQQTEINTGVPVFANTTDRDAAFGGTGEKTLAEGQMAYIETDNLTQLYNGSSWQSASGLCIVQPETAITAAATLTLDGCFTSSYTNYRLMFNYTGAATAQPVIQLRVGGVTAATNYQRQYLDATSTSTSAARVTAQTSLDFGVIEVDFRNSAIIEIFQPAQAQMTNFYISNLYTSGANTTNVVLQHIYGLHSAATAYDGFIVTFGTNATGTYTLYGYGK